MTKIKLKETPTWLRIVRRIYTYLGVSFIGAVLGRLDISNESQILVMEFYLLGGVIIQTICDFSFKTEKLKDLPADPI